MAYKGFDFSMNWSGNLKRDFLPGRLDNAFWGLTSSWANSSVFKDSPVLDYWRPADETNLLGPNTDAYFPKPYFSAETMFFSGALIRPPTMAPILTGLLIQPEILSGWRLCTVFSGFLI